MSIYVPDFTNVDLTFFGVGVTVRCVEQDARDLQFLYGNFSQKSIFPELSIEVACDEWPERGFFTSLLANDKLKKRISIGPIGVAAESMEHTWSAAPSPFPPFFDSTLWDKVASYPGAIVRMVSGEVVAILGDNYVGKTSTAITLCRNGARFVSDSVMVLDIVTGKALPFETPLGFRRESLIGLIPRLRELDHRLTVSVDTGLVALVRPRDIFGKANDPGGVIDKVVYLERDDKDSIRVDHIKTPQPGWFTNASETAQRALLPRQTLRLRVGLGTDLGSIAKSIESEV
jgi:hypothetical protein